MRHGRSDWESGFRPRSRGGYFGRGGVKFVILELLKEQPRHGYDIIREIEERSGGVYTPSPGVIYPTLQALEDQDYVRSQEQEGKKGYAITEAGLAYLESHREQMWKRHTRAHTTPGDEDSGARFRAASGEEDERDRWEWEKHRTDGRHSTREGSGGGFGTWFASGEMPELMRELRWFFGDFAGAIQRTINDPQKLKEIRTVLREAKHKIDQIVMRDA